MSFNSAGLLLLVLQGIFIQYIRKLIQKTNQSYVFDLLWSSWIIDDKWWRTLSFSHGIDEKDAHKQIDNLKVELKLLTNFTDLHRILTYSDDKWVLVSWDLYS